MRFSLFFAGILFLITACVENPCYETQEVIVQYKCYTNSSGRLVDTNLAPYNDMAGVIIEKDTFGVSRSNVLEHDFPVHLEGYEVKLLTPKYRFYECDTVIYDRYDTSYTTPDSLQVIDTVAASKKVIVKELTSAIGSDSIEFQETYDLNHFKVSYDLDPKFVSYECGFIYGTSAIRIEPVILESIDSVVVESHEINQFKHENIKIIF